MFSKIIYYIGIAACLLIIAACFMPWVHYTSINETFTGLNVKKFVTGNYYGRAGIIICLLSAVILIFMLLQKVWAKRVNLFLAAFLLAYSVRTYIIFTSALFEGEIEKKSGIYLMLFSSIVIMIATMFPSHSSSKEENKV